MDRPTMPAPTTATRWGTGRPAAVMREPCVPSVRAPAVAWRCRLTRIRSQVPACAREHKQRRRCSTVLTVTDLVATLGGGLLALGADVPGAEVDDLTLAEPGQGIVGPAGRPGARRRLEPAEAAADLVRARRRRPAPAAWCCGARMARRRTVRDRARRSGIALVELAEHASWAHLVWLLRGVIDRAAAPGPAERATTRRCTTTCSRSPTPSPPSSTPPSPSRTPSRGCSPTPRARTSPTPPASPPSSVAGCRRRCSPRLRARGVFRPLARSAEPVFVPADPGGTLPRLVIPVRAGGEWLGSIWAVVAQRPGPRWSRELEPDGASVVALHLLRLRAQADLGAPGRGRSPARCLTGNATGAEDWLPPGPWRVVALGGRGRPRQRPGRPVGVGVPPPRLAPAAARRPRRPRVCRGAPGRRRARHAGTGCGRWCRPPAPRTCS